MNENRRTFIQCGLAAITAGALPTGLAAERELPRRTIPSSGETLPVIGLGNSNAFREGDLATSRRLLGLLVDQGGRYVDCSGDSRFVVAEAASSVHGADDLFFGSYFMDGDDAALRAEARRLLAMTGRARLDLMQAWPEFAVGNWALFRRWKDDGLTRHIGVARHRPEYYDAMIGLMETGSVDVLQVNYSPLETDAAERVLPMALERGVAVTINRPFLNGRYFSIVAGHELPAWAAEFDCASWAQFSLKFILSHPAVTCVLTETANPKHALDNLGAGFGRLPDAAMRRRIVEHLQALA